MATTFEAYFDESGTHDGAHVLCVAGYLFESEKCRSLDSAWQAMLAKYKLPFFHMVDCVHNVRPFDRLSKEGCIAAETEAISIIREHMLFGSATTVNEPDYNTWAARSELGSAYTYCCWQSMKVMQHWLDQNKLCGDISYFFEAGSSHSAEAGALFQTISSDSDLRKENRYKSHAFVSKEVRPIQAPDIFAWLHANHFSRILKGERKPRKDYVALVEGRSNKAFIATRETVAPELVSGHPALKLP